MVILMSKPVEGTFVIVARLKESKKIVYYAGLDSSNNIIWTEFLSEARFIKDLTKTALDRTVSDVWHLNDRVTVPESNYVTQIRLKNIDKPECFYMAFYGTVDSKSEPISEPVASTQKAAIAISKHFHSTYPKGSYFLYKSRAKFPNKFCQFKYTLISNETGEHSKKYYFIMEVPKNA